MGQGVALARKGRGSVLPELAGKISTSRGVRKAKFARLRSYQHRLAFECSSLTSAFELTSSEAPTCWLCFTEASNLSAIATMSVNVPPLLAWSIWDRSYLLNCWHVFWCRWGTIIKPFVASRPVGLQRCSLAERRSGQTIVSHSVHSTRLTGYKSVRKRAHRWTSRPPVYPKGPMVDNGKGHTPRIALGALGWYGPTGSSSAVRSAREKEKPLGGRRASGRTDREISYEY